METFGSKIRKLRKNKSWTLLKLATQLDIDYANLSKIETGKRNFDEKKLPIFCEIFELDLDKMKNELLSEKFAKKVYAENLNETIFQLAEAKVKYLKSKK